MFKGLIFSLPAAIIFYLIYTGEFDGENVAGLFVLMLILGAPVSLISLVVAMIGWGMLGGSGGAGNNDTSTGSLVLNSTCLFILIGLHLNGIKLFNWLIRPKSNREFE